MNGFFKNAVYPYSETVFSRKDLNTDIYYTQMSMKNSMLSEKEAGPKAYTKYDSMHVKCPEQANPHRPAVD